jgi:hypothetical protein
LPAADVEPTQTRVSVCANCGQELNKRDNIPAVAWHNCCLACWERIGDLMELVDDQPGGAPIQTFRCRQCGDLRSCRKGWQTRCHVCLDERTNESLLEQASQECLAMFAQDPLLGLRVGRNLNIGRDEPITPRVIIEATSCLTVATEFTRYERPGWTVIATDVWGLPWNGIRSRPVSHGTWGRHDACGSVAKLRRGSVDCPACGPQPGSRSHRARREDPYLLYLVAVKGMQKFGVGTQDRVRTHQRSGATVVQVLRATFAEVVLAERKLKTDHYGDLLNRRKRRMPSSFGQGTEVVGHRVAISLTDALSGAEDVTTWF